MKDDLIYAVCGIMAAFFATIVPGYFIFALLVFILILLVKRFGGNDYKFLLYAILISVILRFIGAILLEFYLVKINCFVKIFGYQVPDTFGDSGYYSLRSWWMAQHWMGLPLSDEITREVSLKEYGLHGYLYFLAGIYYLFGFDTILSKLFTSFFGVLLAINIFFITKHISENKLTRRFAFILVSFWPILFLWSITSLKDIPIAFLASLFILGTFKFLRMKLNNISNYAFIGLMISILLVAFFLRRKLNMLFMLPLLMALLIRFRVARWLLAIGCIAFFININFNENFIRTFNTWTNEKLVIFHKGSIITGGNTIKIFPQKYYVMVQGYYGGYRYYVSTLEVAKSIFRGIFLPFIQPLPNRMGLDIVKRCILSTLMALWYVMVIFAVFGCRKLIRQSRRKEEIIILLSSIFFTAASIMLSTGNIGTIIRWRSIIEPFVLIFSAHFFAENYSRLSKSALVSLFKTRRR